MELGIQVITECIQQGLSSGMESAKTQYVLTYLRAVGVPHTTLSKHGTVEYP